MPLIAPPVTTCSATLSTQYNVPLLIPLTVSDPGGYAISVVWTVDGTAVHTDQLPASTASSNLSLSQTFSTVGTHTVVIAATNSLSANSSCITTVTVTKTGQTISFGTLPNIVYGGSDTVLGATASSGDAVAYTASGSCALVGGSVHATGAGSCLVTATQAGDANYNAAAALTQQFTITPATLSVTAQNATRLYGVANPAFTGTIAGVVNGDAITASYASSATATSLVGSYPIVPTLAGSALSNYTATTTNGTLTITPGAPAKLAASTPPVTLVSGGNIGSLTATVQDAGGKAWNLTGRPMSFQAFLSECKMLTQSTAKFIWVPHSFLTTHGLKTDYELKTYAGNFPFWRPEPQLSNIFRISSSKAFNVGWKTRPLADTARDCMSTFGVLQGNTSEWRDYLDPAQEQIVLRQWVQEGGPSHLS